MIFAIRTIFHAFVSTKPPKKARAFLSPFYVVNMFKKKIKNPDHIAYIIKYLHYPMALCIQRHMSLMYDNTRNQFLPDVVLLYSNFSIPMYHSIVWKRPPNMVTKLQYVFFFSFLTKSGTYIRPWSNSKKMKTKINNSLFKNFFTTKYEQIS